ncbi:zinc finger A20 and AN1 domain-containing stress-associated protein 5-like [Momordica charantia]|uniref:Zinc finger A20 and AN1 domain-containing stress-associated protein 5-like n=1 Tax=Momordica charantia TaxID=3673 RepID=A0A6J1CII1_MOMCH|nr:zinc finger A20 and AN1 domain-containing stress-associated protein 5-like [Momordica charantia]
MDGFGSSDNSSNGDPPLCANNCGFFGNPKTRNLCSLCYAAFLRENLISERRQNVEDSLKLEEQVCSDSVRNRTPPSGSAGGSGSSSNSNAPARKNRCGLCNKKVGLLGFNCRCGGLFCGRHRFREEHGCGVDMKLIERERLAKQNVEIKGDKLQHRV